MYQLCDDEGNGRCEGDNSGGFERWPFVIGSHKGLTLETQLLSLSGRPLPSSTHSWYTSLPKQTINLTSKTIELPGWRPKVGQFRGAYMSVGLIRKEVSESCYTWRCCLLPRKSRERFGVEFQMHTSTCASIDHCIVCYGLQPKTEVFSGVACKTDRRFWWEPDHHPPRCLSRSFGSCELRGLVYPSQAFSAAQSKMAAEISDNACSVG